MRVNMKRYIVPVLGMILLSGIAFAQAPAKELYSEGSNPQEYCLALNIYYESRGSNLADQEAVADVVLNRVRDGRYPNTVCEVVKQGKQKKSWKDPNKMVMVRNMCQFSWYCDGKADVPKDIDAWVTAQQIAYFMILDGKYRGISEGATHYHATYVNPEWAKDMALVGRIGAHVFYRWE